MVKMWDKKDDDLRILEEFEVRRWKRSGGMLQ
jgi:hypothetical protein